jgi:hypothetical protein
MSTTKRDGPIPTRFKTAENAFLIEAAAATGIPVCELIRRGVRLMKRQQQLVRGYSFIAELNEQG